MLVLCNAFWCTERCVPGAIWLFWKSKEGLKKHTRALQVSPCSSICWSCIVLLRWWGNSFCSQLNFFSLPFFSLKPWTTDGSALGVPSAAFPHLLKHSFTLGLQVVVLLQAFLYFTGLFLAGILPGHVQELVQPGWTTGRRTKAQNTHLCSWWVEMAAMTDPGQQNQVSCRGHCAEWAEVNVCFHLCPTDLPQASPELQSWKAQSGLWRCPGSATWKILRSGKTVDWVWDGTGKGSEVGQACLQHPNTPKKLEIPQAHTQTVHLKTYTVYFCRFDQKAKTKPEWRHGWKEKRTYLYFKQVLNLGS